MAAALDVPMPPGSSPNQRRNRSCARHHLRIRMPIPPGTSPASIIAALHAHEPVIRNQAFVTGFSTMSRPPPDAVVDPFFMASTAALGSRETKARSVAAPVAYRITEKVPIVPRIYAHAITFSSTFQSMPGGLRCRADAPAGILLWAEYRVVRTPTMHEDEGERYELVEVVTVETSRFKMGFVKKAMEQAHRDICQKIIDQASRQRRMSNSQDSVAT